jgi:hypothetical protein
MHHRGMTRWRRHLQFRRWSLTIQVYKPTAPRRYRSLWRYARGGQATPGPWWTVWVLNRMELTVGHDRTLYGWDDPASDPASKV